jgi:hypothetical protein
LLKFSLGGKTYTVDGWFRTEIGQSLNISFYLNQFYNNPYANPCVKDLKPTFPFIHHVKDSWSRFIVNFSIPLNCVYTFGGPTGQAVWEWKSPSVLYMDNLRIYEAAAAFGDWLPLDYNTMVRQN